jgi:peptide/nickel transport system substrate-binding protein
MPMSATILKLTLILTVAGLHGSFSAYAFQKANAAAGARSRWADRDRIADVSGTHGGTLVTAQRSDPRSFNPITALDTATRELLGLMHADLIHINRESAKTEPALAKDWTVSNHGLVYTVRLRRGLRFSDNHPMDADDVVFTFQVHLDEQMHSAQRDLLVIDGKPIRVVKIDQHTLRFELPAPYAAAERLFDGIAILPRHLLLTSYKKGQLPLAWGVESAPGELAGMGPFRLKRHVSGQHVILERNPHYWKTDRDGKRLPYLDEIVMHVIPTEDAQAIRFQSGELDVVNTLAADTFTALRSRENSRLNVYDAGPGLEYNFLVFNLNERTPDATTRRKQKWFKQLSFRRAVSAAIDRNSIVRLVYRGLGDPLHIPVTEGNPLWVNRNLRHSPRDLDYARKLLRESSFSWRNGELVDPDGETVSFTILVSASSSQRRRMATIVQDDLRQLGMRVSVVSMDSRATQDRILNRQDYEAALMALASGDADPNSDMNVWLLDGSLRIWNMSGGATHWEQEIDKLMRLQMITMDYSDRKKLYDEAQELISENLPIICIASPHVLVGASTRVQRFRPSALRPYSLWNAEKLYLERAGAAK